MEIKRIKLLSSLLVATLFAQNANAIVVDFDELSPGSYHVGDSFTTSDVVVTGQEFFTLSGGSTTNGEAAVIHMHLQVGGEDCELEFSSINLSFDFGTTLNGLSLQYAEGASGSINLDINGDLANVNSFLDLPHSLGGADIFNVDTGYRGAIFIIGTIDSFKIGGEDLHLDNILASPAPTPEPATTVLLGTAGIWVFTRKKLILEGEQG